jgi:hypothetical protein
VILAKYNFIVASSQHLRNAYKVKRILPMAEETIIDPKNITTATNLNQKAGSTYAVNRHRTGNANNEDSTGPK